VTRRPKNLTFELEYERTSIVLDLQVEILPVVTRPRKNLTFELDHKRTSIGPDF